MGTARLTLSLLMMGGQIASIVHSDPIPSIKVRAQIPSDQIYNVCTRIPICLYEVALHQAILNNETNTPNFIILCPSIVGAAIKEMKKSKSHHNTASPSLVLLLVM